MQKWYKQLSDSIQNHLQFLCIVKHLWLYAKWIQRILFKNTYAIWIVIVDICNAFIHMHGYLHLNENDQMAVLCNLGVCVINKDVRNQVSLFSAWK